MATIIKTIDIDAPAAAVWDAVSDFGAVHTRFAPGFVTNVELGPTQVGGIYRDRFERRNGRWGIVERVFDLHYFTPVAGWNPAHGSETAPLSELIDRR